MRIGDTVTFSNGIEYRVLEFEIINGLIYAILLSGYYTLTPFVTCTFRAGESEWINGYQAAKIASAIGNFEMRTQAARRP